MRHKVLESYTFVKMMTMFYCVNSCNSCNKFSVNYCVSINFHSFIFGISGSGMISPVSEILDSLFFVDYLLSLQPYKLDMSRIHCNIPSQLTLNDHYLFLHFLVFSFPHGSEILKAIKSLVRVYVRT